MLNWFEQMATLPKALKSDKVPWLNFQNQMIGEDCHNLPLLPLPRKHLQTIGVYLCHLFGCNVRFRLLKELGSSDSIRCVVEIVWPCKFSDIRIGIPQGVLK